MKVGLDEYDRKARLSPALLFFLPATLTIAGLAPAEIIGWSGALAVVIQAGGAYLLAQTVGDIGKRKEPALFKAFGGRPTEQLLSHAKAPNKTTLAQRHQKLVGLMPKVRIPTAKDEQRDLSAAMDVYSACVDRLRGIARADKGRWPDVHRENIHYGFRRNLWALKPAGFILPGVALLILLAVMGGEIVYHQPVAPIGVAIAAVDALMLAAWVFLIRVTWVERSAFLYADRLLEVLDLF